LNYVNTAQSWHKERWSKQHTNWRQRSKTWYKYRGHERRHDEREGQRRQAIRAAAPGNAHGAVGNGLQNRQQPAPHPAHFGETGFVELPQPQDGGHGTAATLRDVQGFVGCQVAFSHALANGLTGLHLVGEA